MKVTYYKWINKSISPLVWKYAKVQNNEVLLNHHDARAWIYFGLESDTLKPVILRNCVIIKDGLNEMFLDML